MRFEEWKGWFHGCDAVVGGCGPSARRLLETQDIARPTFTHGGACVVDRWSLVCNRMAAEIYDPDFAVCLEPPRDKCWQVVKDTTAPVVFSHILRGKRGNQPHPRICQIPGQNVYEWFDQETPDGEKPLHLGQSAFYAAAIAGYLGFETIGLIGVDLTADRWVDATPPSRAWCRLRDSLAEAGHRLVNLSPDSRLEGIEKAPWSEVRCK